MRHLTRREQRWLREQLCPNRRPFPPPLAEGVEGHPVGGRTVTRDTVGGAR